MVILMMISENDVTSELENYESHRFLDFTHRFPPRKLGGEKKREIQEVNKSGQKTSFSGYIISKSLTSFFIKIFLLTFKIFQKFS